MLWSNSRDYVVLFSLRHSTIVQTVQQNRIADGRVLSVLWSSALCSTVSIACATLSVTRNSCYCVVCLLPPFFIKLAGAGRLCDGFRVYRRCAQLAQHSRPCHTESRSELFHVYGHKFKVRYGVFLRFLRYDGEKLIPIHMTVTIWQNRL